MRSKRILVSGIAVLLLAYFVALLRNPYSPIPLRGATEIPSQPKSYLTEERMLVLADKAKELIATNGIVRVQILPRFGFLRLGWYSVSEGDISEEKREELVAMLRENHLHSVRIDSDAGVVMLGYYSYRTWNSYCYGDNPSEYLKNKRYGQVESFGERWAFGRK